MKIFIIFSLFGLALGQIHGQPRQQNGEPRDDSCADMPTFMQNADRIVGGEDAPSPIPWQVAVLSGTFQYCGATVLDAYTILCAAHCQPTTSHSIRVGSTSKSSGGQFRSIAQVIYNNNPGFQYNSGTLNNDFVILKLSDPLELNDNVKPACLPSSGYLGVSSTEERCFTSGWGTLSSGGSATDDLKYVRVPAITNAQCNNDYGDGQITDAMICAGYPGEGGKDACQGDSGGPFVCNDDGKAVLAGVVSWGNGCALAEYPGVYARTTHVLDWIKSKMGETDITPTTAPPPASGCGSPEWVGDNYCDDENNNEECEYDGGDCCNNTMDGWDDFCEQCECKDPNAGTSECVDEFSTEKCQNNIDKCNRIWWGRNCKETCGFCGCVNILSTAKCEKKEQKGKCNRPFVAEVCKETCNLC
jgi:trypsin